MPSPGRGASQRSIQSDATSGGGHPGGLLGKEVAVGGMGGLVGIEEDMKEKQPGCVCHVNMICMNI